MSSCGGGGSCPVCYEEYIYPGSTTTTATPTIGEEQPSSPLSPISPSSSSPSSITSSSAASSTPSLIPRKLPCGDMTCTGCLQDAMCETQLTCQVCMQTFTFPNGMDDIKICHYGEEDMFSDSESICSENSMELGFSSMSEGEGSDAGSVGGGGGGPSSRGTSEPSMSPVNNVLSSSSSSYTRVSYPPHGASSGSKFSDFVNGGEGGSGGGRSGGGGGMTRRRADSDSEAIKKEAKSCTIPGCPNKRGHRGYCADHSNAPHQSLSAESAKRATKKLEKAKLSRLTFKPGDRLKVCRKNESEEEEASPWGRVDPEELVTRFKAHKLMELGEVLDLIDQSREVLMKEPNILQLQSPVTAVGDIHGQFFDLLHLIENGGPPGQTSYLFLGDYVDRGKFSCEVILYLLALKVCYPRHIHLIRGNHESRGTTGYFGFKEECKAKYGLPVYYRFLLCFECLPLCAVIQTSYGRLFACHGGISPEISTLEEIERIDRFVEPDCKGALCDILWSDPLHESPHLTARGGGGGGSGGQEGGGQVEKDRYEEFLSVEWKPNYERGCSFYFGYRAIRKFLDDNDLICLIRAHQVQEEGFRRHFYSPEHLSPDALRSSSGPLSSLNAKNMLPPVVTIFSAPNYCDRYGNKAAFLRIGLEPKDLSFEQFDCVPPPLLNTQALWSDLAMSSAHNLAIIKTCPYMPTTFRELFKVAMELGAETPLSASPLSSWHLEERSPSTYSQSSTSSSVASGHHHHHHQNLSSAHSPPSTTGEEEDADSVLTTPLSPLASPLEGAGGTAGGGGGGEKDGGGAGGGLPIDRTGSLSSFEDYDSGCSLPGSGPCSPVLSPLLSPILLQPSDDHDDNSSLVLTSLDDDHRNNNSTSSNNSNKRAALLPLSPTPSSSSIEHDEYHDVDDDAHTPPISPPLSPQRSVSFSPGGHTTSDPASPPPPSRHDDDEEEEDAVPSYTEGGKGKGSLRNHKDGGGEGAKGTSYGSRFRWSGSSSSIASSSLSPGPSSSSMTKKKAATLHPIGTKKEGGGGGGSSSRHRIGRDQRTTKSSGGAIGGVHHISVIRRPGGGSLGSEGGEGGNERNSSSGGRGRGSHHQSGSESSQQRRLLHQRKAMGDKRGSEKAVKTRSSLYMLAAARDGINEMHPEILEKRIKVIAEELSRQSRRWRESAGAAISSAGGLEALDVCKGFSVSELCARFELGMLGANVFGARYRRDGGGEEGDDEGDDDDDDYCDDDDQGSGGEEEKGSEAGGDRTSETKRRRRRRKSGRGGGAGSHQRHSSLEAMKLTANSVAELKVFFEMFSQRHAEKQIRRSGSGGSGCSTPSRGHSSESLDRIGSGRSVSPQNGISASPLSSNHHGVGGKGGVGAINTLSGRPLLHHHSSLGGGGSPSQSPSSSPLSSPARNGGEGHSPQRRSASVSSASSSSLSLSPLPLTRGGSCGSSGVGGIPSTLGLRSPTEKRQTLTTSLESSPSSSSPTRGTAGGVETGEGGGAAAAAPTSLSMSLRGGALGGPSPAEMFTHDEIITLRLIFSLFDDNGDDYVDMQELVRYSEETGDYALPHQAMECIRVIDVDGDGRIGLWDYINLAARLKELHRINQHSLIMLEIRKRYLEKKSKASATV